MHRAKISNPDPLPLAAAVECFRVACDDATLTGDWDALQRYADELSQLQQLIYKAARLRAAGKIDKAKTLESLADDAYVNAIDAATSIEG